MGEKHFSKLVELLNLEKKPRTTPEATGYEEDPPDLAGEQRQRFATAVGVLLCMSADRPDAQHCIRVLASQLRCPTRSDYQRLEHLVLYLKGTSGYAIHMARTKPGRSVLDPWTRTYRAPVKIYWKSLQSQTGQEIAAQGKV